MAAATIMVSAHPHQATGTRFVGAYHPSWSAAHADAANSDYLPRRGEKDLKLAWSRKFDGMINLGPTNDGRERVYVTTSGAGCRLHALDRETGKTVWCSDALDRLAVSSSPLIDRNGHLYIADGLAMRSFDQGGRVRWTTPIIGAPLSAQFTPAGDLLFITHVGVIYVLDRWSGRAIITPHQLVPNPSFNPAEGARACMRGLPDCPIANTPAMDLQSGRFYFTFWAPGARAAGVRAMRITPGRAPRLVADWISDGLPSGSASSPDLSADGSRLYVTDNDGSLHALNTANGALIWSIPIGYTAGGSVSLSPGGLAIPAGGRGAALMAIEDKGSEAKVLWSDIALENFGIAPQTAGFLAYPTVSTGSGGADLLVIDTRTGEVLDRERIPGRPFFTVGTTIDLNGTVYVPTIRGELHAFRSAGARGD